MHRQILLTSLLVGAAVTLDASTITIDKLQYVGPGVRSLQISGARPNSKIKIIEAGGTQDLCEFIDCNNDDDRTNDDGTADIAFQPLTSPGFTLEIGGETWPKITSAGRYTSNQQAGATTKDSGTVAAVDPPVGPPPAVFEFSLGDLSGFTYAQTISLRDGTEIQLQLVDLHVGGTFVLKDDGVYETTFTAYEFTYEPFDLPALNMYGVVVEVLDTSRPLLTGILDASIGRFTSSLNTLWRTTSGNEIRGYEYLQADILELSPGLNTVAFVSEGQIMPEPSILFLCGTGLTAGVAWRRRRTARNRAVRR